jgi:hypothetical protein
MSDIKISPEDVPLAAQIVSGLLASGHYTFIPGPDEDSDGTHVFRSDCGDEWEKHGFSQRYVSLAVEEALEMLREIKHACQRDADS